MRSDASQRATIWGLLVLGLVSLGVAAFAASRVARAEGSDFHGTAYPGAPPAPEFVLTDHTGALTSLADFRGRAVLVFFGYTRCPDVCPLTLRKVRRVLDAAELGPEDVTVLLVTVDPAHDTPERLAEYVAGIGQGIVGLTADSVTIARVLADYDAYASPATDHDGHPTLAHSTIMFGIDRAGRLRVLIHAEEPSEIVDDDLRALARIRA